MDKNLLNFSEIQLFRAAVFQEYCVTRACVLSCGFHVTLSFATILSEMDVSKIAGNLVRCVSSGEVSLLLKSLVLGLLWHGAIPASMHQNQHFPHCLFIQQQTRWPISRLVCGPKYIIQVVFLVINRILISRYYQSKNCRLVSVCCITGTVKASASIM